MSEPAAILATFSDLKLIKTRKVAQLVFEVPIESVRSATEALGWPTGEQWCGIARVVTKPAGGTDLNRGGADQSRQRLNETPPAGPFGDAQNREDGTARPTATTSPKPNSTRAVMMAKDEGFWQFINSQYPSYFVNDEVQADRAIKELCGVSSKAELNANGPAVHKFNRMRAAFRDWQADSSVS